MHISTNHILKFLYILSWVIIIGICIEATAIIISSVATLWVGPDRAGHLWRPVDLYALYRHDPGHFAALTFVIVIVAVSKAWIFGLIIRMLHGKKLDLSQPFNRATMHFILWISCFSFLIGLFSWRGVEYSRWFMTQGVSMPDAEYLQLGGADVWLFMSVVLFVVAQIFKKGIEIQEENELTV
jgi:hypothetical protein